MTSTAPTLTFTRPDDWHLHVRDGAAMMDVVPHSAAQFARAVIMPNLRPPVTTTAQALAYKGAHPGGGAGRRGFPAADDALPDRQHTGR